MRFDPSRPNRVVRSNRRIEAGFWLFRRFLFQQRCKSWAPLSRLDIKSGRMFDQKYHAGILPYDTISLQRSEKNFCAPFPRVPFVPKTTGINLNSGLKFLYLFIFSSSRAWIFWLMLAILLPWRLSATVEISMTYVCPWRLCIVRSPRWFCSPSGASSVMRLACSKLTAIGICI